MAGPFRESARGRKSSAGSRVTSNPTLAFRCLSIRRERGESVCRCRRVGTTRSPTAIAAFDPDDCVLPEQGDVVKLTRAQETELPDIVSLTFIDGSGNYEPGTVSASRIAGYSERKTDVTVPLVMDEIQAQTIAGPGARGGLDRKRDRQACAAARPDRARCR
jgi:hypothetical protein